MPSMKPSRRELLKIGSLAGLSMAEILRLQETCAFDQKPAKEINCIFIFVLGGMPHQDMWDLTPDAPATLSPLVQLCQVSRSVTFCRRLPALRIGCRSYVV